jgi:hypothetical protein
VAVLRSSRVVLVGVLMATCLATSACSPPPVLTQAQFVAKKLPKRHPTINDTQKQNCQVCHKVVATPPAKQ